jgi:hypothetical protein
MPMKLNYVPFHRSKCPPHILECCQNYKILRNETHHKVDLLHIKCNKNLASLMYKIENNIIMLPISPKGPIIFLFTSPINYMRCLSSSNFFLKVLFWSIKFLPFGLGIYIGERRTTFAKTYGIKVRCYLELFGKHVWNLGTLCFDNPPSHPPTCM